MTAQDFQDALAIITKSNNVKVSFNVPINDNYGSTYLILLHDCCAKLIDDLTIAGFSLFLHDKKGISIEKFKGA